ncbi:MAG: hypothetical protein IJQ82_01155 [Selenomonadaceae bacterium]|nr:hypothetical protein [Selenomonadaceae bacterium]
MAKYIKFTVGGFFSGYKTVEIAIVKDTATYKILRNGLLSVGNKKSSEKNVSEAWLKKLDALNIFEWEKNYHIDILDGEQWELTFKDGKKVYRGQGSNDYPENWEKFLDWLDELIPEMEFVNRKRLEKITLDYSRESAIGYMISEILTLDRHEKILTLDKKNAYVFANHIYNLGEATEKIFDSCQKFFDELEIFYAKPDYPAQMKIELIRHDGSIENFETPYSENFLPGINNLMNELKNCANDLTAEIFSPAPAEIANSQGKYILCKVQFKGSYKHYTYQTEDETLAVGDMVDVPVGRFNDVNQAKIVEIGYFDEYEAPFPIDRIKKIIGKHVADEWENY